MRARAVAALMTKISGLPWRSAMSTVAPTARRSCGLGRVGTITRSAWATTWEIEWVMAGGVSITAMRTPILSNCASAAPRSRHADLDEMRLGRLARVPPMRQAALRIGVDQRHGAGARFTGFHRQMPGQGGLARSALLGGRNDGVHAIPFSRAVCLSAMPGFRAMKPDRRIFIECKSKWSNRPACYLRSQPYRDRPRVQFGSFQGVFTVRIRVRNWDRTLFRECMM